MRFGMTELLIILGIVVLVFGTKRLKNIGKDMGGAIADFKDAMDKPEQTEQVSEKVQKPAELESKAQNSPASQTTKDKETV